MRHRLKRSRFLAQLPALLLLLPLLLAACGGDAATVAPAPTAAGVATAAATRPATTAAGTSAPAPAATTAGGTTAATMPAAAGGAAPTTAAAAPKVENLTLPATSKRGEGGTLRLLWWQAPTIINSHLAAGTKDTDASRFVNEPLATFTSTALTPDVPVLAKEIPSVQNGGLAADGTSVTWKLKDGITWSDGMPLIADDVVATFKFITNKANGATSISTYDTVQDVVAVDKGTVKITFKAATPV